MRKQIRPLVFVACIAALLPMGVPTAQANQCSVARPADPHGHWWSWRLIDGRKCWYEGKAMISKSSLQWSSQASAQPKPDAGPKRILTQKPDDPLDAQASAFDSDSFEARWRARALNN
jgi:hypothetical protein